MHTLSIAIAEASISRGWIKAQDKLWCAYAVEKKLISLCLFLLIIPIALVLDVPTIQEDVQSVKESGILNSRM